MRVCGWGEGGGCLEVNGHPNWLFTNILENVFFCVPKKVMQVWNNQR